MVMKHKMLFRLPVTDTDVWSHDAFKNMEDLEEDGGRETVIRIYFQ